MGLPSGLPSRRRRLGFGRRLRSLRKSTACGSRITKDGKVILIKLDAGGLTIELAFPHAKALELAVILTREADRAALRHG